MAPFFFFFFSIIAAPVLHPPAPKETHGYCRVLVGSLLAASGSLSAGGPAIGTTYAQCYCTQLVLTGSGCGNDTLGSGRPSRLGSRHPVGVDQKDFVLFADAIESPPAPVE
ncbi:hypothetical protein MGG_17387 [Pyricularia oryzae 70-15]|uniref:Secreted protein n=1 Tax=Pyricularia oryzae (strain 70-15 / ATCC MYA-4617 / FGSC 8958) TaxID=242507 RepID=G4NEX2_PYRO7|nr:uncharacterized protein MGG_17387 [Pyricularia oryzae 70-15]EHA48698.1 hypothetical protein MGG_17387 [Pyricularia oryzae 70-15]